MPPILSTNGYIGVGKQGSFGTPVAPTANLFMKYLSEGIVQEQEDIKATEGGQGRYTIEAYKSTHKVAGDISFYARPDILGFFIGMLMGKDTLVAKVPATTPSVHTFEVAIPHNFTIERGIGPSVPTLIERFQDCVINSLTIDGESSQPIKCTASIIGTKGVKQVAAGTPTYEVNDPLMFFDSPTYTIDGGGTVEISKFSIKINNNIDIWYGTTLTPAELIEKLITIDLNFTLKFLNATHYTKVYYNAGTAIVDSIADGSFRAQATYGALDGIRAMDLQIKHIKHISAPVNLAGEAGPIMQECVGYAVKVGADNLIDPIIKNSFDVDYDT